MVQHKRKQHGTRMKTISLVLSSGGARGLVHIGAIRCLEELGYKIELVAGSSMGALVGGVYATGKLDDYEHWVRALRRSDIVKLLDLGWTSGLFKGDRIISVLRELVGDWTIEELEVDFTAVATELNRKREVWINEGSLFDAIRASMAIPMVFAPVIRGNQCLVDGGVLNPLPIGPTLSNGSDFVIAIDVNGADEFGLSDSPSFADSERHEPADDTDPSNSDRFRRAVANFMEEWFSGTENDKPDRGMFDVALESMDAMQVTISRFKQSVYSPDLLVQIPRNVAHFFEFERADELIELGYERTREALKQ